MEGYSRKVLETCPQLLDLIPKDREWVLQRDEQRSHGCSEEKKLELRLGPPGHEDWAIKESARERDESLLSIGYFSNMASSITHNNNTSGAKRGFMDTVDDHRKSTTSMEDGWVMTNNGSQTHKLSSSKTQEMKHQITKGTPFLHQFPSSPVMAKESSQSQTCCAKVVDLQSTEKKAFSPPSVNTAVTNSSQKRTAPAPVVGWPPIRSFRKNLASSSSSKPSPESQNVEPSKVASEKPVESCRKGMFVKINMDGVPIGRKVDLKAYDSYEKLSSAVDELFRDLLAAQRDSSADGIQNKQEGEEAIIGSFDGNGEYTLVYEDNEGDKLLVGDVPWHMFVSTVKRLRVLKSSELPTLCSVGSKQEKIQLGAAKK